MNPRYSLVVPVHNEARSIEPLVDAAVGVLAARHGGHEIILVDDGSTDGTAVEIVLILARWRQCRALRHAVNQGQGAALLTGLRAARGEVILTMDGDGQNDPRDFPELLAAVESGALDMACGWRVERQDSWVRQGMSRIANTVRRRVLADGLHDAGCQLRVFRREIVDALVPAVLLQAFLPAMAVAAGYRVGERPVRHHPRRYGREHYGLRQLAWRPAVAMVGLWWRLR